MTREQLRLAEFDRRRDEVLREWEQAKKSGRLLLYLDVRSGELIEAGELEARKPWIAEKP